LVAERLPTNVVLLRRRLPVIPAGSRFAAAMVDPPLLPGVRTLDFTNFFVELAQFVFARKSMEVNRLTDC
jgi:hypothetical protein